MDNQEFYNVTQNVQNSENNVYVLNGSNHEETNGFAVIWANEDELPEELQHEDISIVREAEIVNEPIHPHVHDKDEEDMVGRTRMDIRLEE